MIGDAAACIESLVEYEESSREARRKQRRDLLSVRRLILQRLRRSIARCLRSEAMLMRRKRVGRTTGSGSSGLGRDDFGANSHDVDGKDAVEEAMITHQGIRIGRQHRRRLSKGISMNRLFADVCIQGRCADLTPRYVQICMCVQICIYACLHASMFMYSSNTTDVGGRYGSAQVR